MATPETDPKSLPEDALPPVSPPSSLFVLQLFFIPLLIVTVIVLVWLTFSWLAHMGNDHKKLIKGLKQGNDASWQNAGTLANLLRDERRDHLKTDPELARELASLLNEQIDSAKMDENRLKLRIFTCRAMGEFRTPLVLPALLRAAETERDPKEIAVRRAALEAIALLTRNLQPTGSDKKLQTDQELLDVLAATVRQRGNSGEDPVLRGELRSAAAYALGVLGGDQAIDLLAEVCGDSYANARYNAAAGLARYGDIRAQPVLVEMLDPTSKAAIDGETTSTGKEFKRVLVLTNAARAAGRLATGNKDGDLSALKAALQKLTGSKQIRAVSIAAEEALANLKSRSKKAG